MGLQEDFVAVCGGSGDVIFFRNVSLLLNAGGKLVVADWFKAEDLTDAQVEADIKPIEGETHLYPHQKSKTAVLRNGIR